MAVKRVASEKWISVCLLQLISSSWAANCLQIEGHIRGLKRRVMEASHKSANQMCGGREQGVPQGRSANEALTEYIVQHRERATVARVGEGALIHSRNTLVSSFVVMALCVIISCNLAATCPQLLLMSGSI